MAKKPRTKEVDHGFKGIIKELRKLEYKPIVKIGFPFESKKPKQKHKGGGEDSFVTVLEIAIWNEFGTIRSPERSFIRAAFDKNRKKYLKMNKDLLLKIYSGKITVEKALDLLGETILNDIKTFLTNDEVTPKTLRKENASDATASFAAQLENIARAEGFESGESKKTLIDTAQMMNSLTYKRIMKP